VVVVAAGFYRQDACVRQRQVNQNRDIANVKCEGQKQMHQPLLKIDLSGVLGTGLK
jgi:hypothetical protein